MKSFFARRSPLFPLKLFSPGNIGFVLIAGNLSAVAHAEHVDIITVTSLLNKPQDQSSVPVTVITDENLRRRAAGTIGATLDGSPGLTSASFGPGVGQPVIRGQNGPRVMTLLNGTASADAAAVSADHAVTVEPMLAESIEILRGPATLLYGGGAIGGIVNIVDNRIPQKLSGKVHGAIEQRHDSVNDGNTSVARLDGSVGQLAYHLDGVYREWNNVDIPGVAFNRQYIDPQFSSDGFTANTDGRNHTLNGGLSWIADDGHFGFSVSDMQNHYGIPLDDEAEGDAINGVHIDMKQKRYDVAAEKRDISDTIDALRWRLTHSDYRHREIENTGEIGTIFTDETWETRFELAHAPLSGWSGAFGLQLKRSDFAAEGEESFIPESIAESAGLFALESYRRGAVIYQLGARYGRDSLDPKNHPGPEGAAANANVPSKKDFNSFSGSASASWTMSETWRLGVALSRSQRAPTVEELYSNATSEFGDLIEHEATHAIEVGAADLKQETARNVDVTLHYQSERAHGYVTVFRNDFHDFIALTDTGVEQHGTPILAYAQRDARFTGIEFEMELPIVENRSGVWSVDVYGDRIRGEFVGNNADGDNDDIPRLPPLRIGARLNVERGSFSAYAGILHAAKQNHSGAFETQTDGYNRIDAGLSYQLKAGDDFGALLFLRATNLTDRTIRNSVSLLKDVAPEPGRSIETGVRFTF